MMKEEREGERGGGRKRGKEGGSLIASFGSMVYFA